jgi:Na+-transporting NADH:ubiquinone oxidoreductase subunit C
VPEPESIKPPSNAYTIGFIVVLSLICALILSILASALAAPKEAAKELDRSRQMLIAAKILDHQGYFLYSDKEGKFVPNLENGKASGADILKVYNQRIVAWLTNDKGEIKSFKDLGIDKTTYENTNRKLGYYKQKWKLFYEVLPENSKDEKAKPIGYVIPVNGYGLWDAIYGYLALEPDADSVIGITWYDQKETPGLGANIAEASWQMLFDGKKIFQESPDGKTDFNTAPLGITVVKGKVSEVLGSSPKAKSAVDGMTGATLTGNGVNDAFKAVLAAYKPFLIKIQQENSKEK